VPSGVDERTDEGRDPVADLRRIAFLLERQLESSYRVKAFRGAAAALLPLDPAQVRSRVESGSLREVRGIGERTAAIIAESVAGREPEYLTKLEEEARIPLAEGGEELLAALRGDCHTHSDWSDGGSPIPEMAVTAIELGHEWMVLTDHSPRLTVANGLSPERLRRQLDVIAALRPHLAPFRLLTGIEVDILPDGSLDQQDELLAELDVVVASVHSELKMESAAMTRRMVTAVSNPHVDILGHCTGRNVMPRGRSNRTRPESQFDARRVFEACFEHGTAVEINSRPERLDPPKRLLSQAVGIGCLFSIDTDGHAPGQLSWQVYGASRAEQCEVPVERVVTTWSADDLLRWTADHTVRPES
jgi:putative hydrolase